MSTKKSHVMARAGTAPAQPPNRLNGGNRSRSGPGRGQRGGLRPDGGSPLTGSGGGSSGVPCLLLVLALPVLGPGFLLYRSIRAITRGGRT
jgi:hypothetical protein